MAGGSGTRFWPASRNARPKQLLPLASADGTSLLSATLARLDEGLVPRERVYVVTAQRLHAATVAAVPGLDPRHVLAEPVPRNTAAAIGWSTATVARTDPDALIGVFPSDHVVANHADFRLVVDRAFGAAESGRLTLIGIVPTRPETGYGYIERGDEVTPGVFEVLRFVEKPVLPVAEEYVAGKRHFWNAGMFFFRARPMLDAIRESLPALAAGLDAIEAEAARGKEAEAVARIFPQLPDVSIDHGVMERASNVAVVPGEFGWSDVGSWESAWELAPKDAAGNALPDDTVAVDARGNLVWDLTTGSAPRRRFALLGVEDLVLVETDDAVLLMPRARAQEVRAVVAALKGRGETDRL